jgi:ubiquinone/menaquinone biosynthesis C-methylase UbiE
MQEQKNVIDCYDKTAENYADKFINELEHKNLDQILLRAFIKQNITKGKLIDLGCGPGQTTRFIYENGLTNLIGADLSSEMVKVASKNSPHIKFEQVDLLDLKYLDKSFASGIAFYAIVHFDYNQLKTALREVKRILTDNGHFLFSFHIGNKIIHLDNFLDKDVDVEFIFFEVEIVKEILVEVGFEIIDIIKRQPYKTEHQSERAYFWIKNCH